MNINDMLDKLVGVEGGYSNNPSDSGGETIWGITIAVARENGYNGVMQDMPKEIAKKIYKSKYFIGPRFSDVAELSEALAEEMFDSGVNMGVKWPATALQRVLNAMNAKGKLYPDGAVDGLIGPATLAALKAYLAFRKQDGEDTLLKAMNCLQGAYYLSITEGREANEDFIYGWLKNRVHLAKGE
jgi:lysozyme family protein